MEVALLTPWPASLRKDAPCCGLRLSNVATELALLDMLQGLQPANLPLLPDLLLPFPAVGLNPRPDTCLDLQKAEASALETDADNHSAGATSDDGVHLATAQEVGHQLGLNLEQMKALESTKGWLASHRHRLASQAVDQPGQDAGPQVS